MGGAKPTENDRRKGKAVSLMEPFIESWDDPKPIEEIRLKEEILKLELSNHDLDAITSFLGKRYTDRTKSERVARIRRLLEI